jgi:hypothetical protein
MMKSPWKRSGKEDSGPLGVQNPPGKPPSQTYKPVTSSLEERYKSHDDYVNRVGQAARELERQRLLLPEDVAQYVERAQKSDVLK